MLESAALGLFAAALITCIAMGWNILYALMAGYAIFFGYGLVRRFAPRDLLKMSLNGVRTIKNMLIVFVLIGMITAVWRACGTIPFIIYHASGFVLPRIFILVTFLLCCLISTLTGTAFGSVATVGVICMTLSRPMGISPVFMGGAILSGVYYGDRCSPMSTSALLVSELTGTDIYRNIKNMIRTAAVPFGVACLAFYLMGRGGEGVAADTDIWDLFAQGFNLHPATVLPALIIVVLCVVRVPVRIAMIASIAAGAVLCLVLQGTDVAALLKMLVLGYRAPDARLSAMLDGGGVISMLRVIGIVCLSSSYAGIFDGTGLLGGAKALIRKLSEKTGSFGAMAATAVVTSMVACNQTLSIMLTHQLCRETVENPEELAVNLENTAVVIPPLIPWSIACAVTLSTVGAPNTSILAAVYLYIIVLWNLAVSWFKTYKKQGA